MNKVKLIYIIFIYIASFRAVIAQNADADSLERLVIEHKQNDTVKVNLLNKAAYKFHTLDINKTLQYANEAIELSAKLNFKEGKAEGLRIKGIYFLLKTNYEQALRYFNQSLIIFEESGNQKGTLDCLINIGNVNRNQANYDFALENFQRSLIIAESINDQKGMANCLIHIGIIYYEIQDYPKALDYYRKSLQIYEEIDDKLGIAYALNDIALCYEKQNKLDKALEYYDRSIAIGKEIDFVHILGWAYDGKGHILMKEEKYEDALKYFLLGLEKREILYEKKDIAQSYNSIGNLYVKTNQFSKAKHNLLRAFEIAKEINNHINLKDAAEGLSAVYEHTGNYQKSLQYYKVYKQYSDSLLNQQNIQKLNSFEIRTEYEREKLNREIEQQKKDAMAAEKAKRQKIVNITSVLGFIMMTILALAILYSFIAKRTANQILTRQKNEIEEKNAELQNLNEEIQTQAEELKDKNDQLIEINATKDKLFSIIAHDLKSPFGSLLGITEQLANHFQSYSKNEQVKYINFLNQGALKTYRLLENLLTWSQSQTGRIHFSPEQINIEVIINEMVSLFDDAAREKQIKLIKNTYGELDVFADKIMIETVIRNLLTNAIKFTPKGGEISIKSELLPNDNKEQYVRISVKDSGVGIPSEIQSKLFSIADNITTKGTENESGTGLGLIICKEFVEKHKGTIRVESEMNKGSEFVFTIPLTN